MSRWAAIALLALGCADSKSGEPSRPTPATVPARVDDGSGSAGPTGEPAAPPAPPPVELADSPTIDLLANRYLIHAGASDSLIVPIAAEGARKYTQDYNQPWGDVVVVDGGRGRLLSRRSTTLRVPWHGGDAGSIRIRAHGLVAGQRLSVRVNGKKSGSLSLEAGWQTVSVAATGIAAGENEIGLYVGRQGKVRGTTSWALWHSLVIGPAAGAGKSPPVLESVSPFAAGGEERPALTGHARFAIYAEIPETAHLVVDTGASSPADLAVRATTATGKTHELFSARQSDGWHKRIVSLAPIAGELVVLELVTSVPEATGWAGPRIALEKAGIADPPPPTKNAVLVVVDALRSDKLRAYEPDTRVEAPRMNAEIAARGAVFIHNQAASPSSPPSHGSIQTGMIPRVHGVVGDKAELTPRTPMLSTQSRAAGIAAGYYGNNSFGMARLEAPGNWTAFHQPSHEGKGNDCSALIPEMLGFARAQTEAGKRFVISSLPYETHTPYRYHAGISEKYHSGTWGPPVGKRVDGVLLSALGEGKTTLTKSQWSQLYALYDGEVTYFDGCFATLLEGLDELGVADDTAIILTSDHGEGMFEHGRMGHAWGHHAELGNIPLVFFVPGLTDGGKRIEVPSSHIDIVPTILDLLGVEADARVQGRSLVPLMLRRGPWIPRVVSLEYGRSYSLRARGWRYIVDYNGGESLFELAVDPGEHNDVRATRPIALRYARDLAGFFLAHRSRWTVPRWGDLNNHSPAFAAAMTP